MRRTTGEPKAVVSVVVCVVDAYNNTQTMSKQPLMIIIIKLLAQHQIS